ncbi:MAG: hemerythrin domain-containing protein [Terriglobales bacterium]
MPVQIGEQTHSFANPTNLLSDCHRRIEMFLGVLAAVAAAVERPLNDEARGSLDTALRYFREAAPKHTADEEESLFPRLQQFYRPDVAHVLARLRRLEADHRRVTPLHALVERLGTEYIESGISTPAKAAEFRAAVAELADIYKEHIKIEDGVVFPLAAQLLSAKDKQNIAHEMAERRNLSPTIEFKGGN